MKPKGVKHSDVRVAMKFDARAVKIGGQHIASKAMSVSAEQSKSPELHSPFCEGGNEC